ncbi:MAG TPA: RHS repeat-associated core domain-containing protein, partial [Thermoanaerobaculia bacterium]|nr:RHS repeat-associated core domain-containing protein [Thermoanaerobaculia bacterium]
LVVSLACKRKKVATVPASVIVPGGALSASFVVTTSQIHSTQTVDVTATYAGVTRTASITVTRSIASLSIFGRLARVIAARHTPVSLSVTAPVAETLGTTEPRRYSIYAPELNLLAESETTTATTPAIAYEYVWFNGQPLAQIATATNEVSWYFNDHLGTPVLTTDASGAVDWRVEREPYGEIYAVRAGAGRHQPLAFPGQEDDGELSYNVFRWYRAGWGRYSQPDPLSRRTWIDDPFTYANANPVRFFDRKGLLPGETEDKCLICTVYAESRGLPDACQFAVASVIMNRLADDRAKGKTQTVCGIVSKAGQFDGYGNENYKACLNNCPGKKDKPDLDHTLDLFKKPFPVNTDARFFANNSEFYVKLLDTYGEPVSVPGCDAFTFAK